MKQLFFKCVMGGKGGGKVPKSVTYYLNAPESLTKIQIIIKLLHSK